MCCFFVPTAEAVVLATASLALNHLNIKGGKSLAFHCKRLSQTLFGGSVLLAVEHMWHGELTAYPPFITAMKSPKDTAEMLHELATVGVSMAVLVTVVYLVYSIAEKLLSGSKKGVVSEQQAGHTAGN